MKTTHSTITLTASELNTLCKAKELFERFAIANKSIEWDFDTMDSALVISDSITDFIEEYEQIKEDEEEYID